MDRSDQIQKLVAKLQAWRKPGLWLLPLLLLALGFWFSLPQTLFVSPYSSLVLGSDGRLLSAQIAEDEQWRFPLKGETPERFSLALLQYEDKRFYTHPGIDPLALVRAAYLNLKHARVVSGGSTITMQVIRMSRNNPRRTLGEKVLELILALRLELQYSKKEILAMYASHAPFGGNVVGLEAAAWRYFGREAEQMTWAEASLLAVLPNQPSLIHPGRNRQQLKSKRDALLAKLYKQGHLKELDYQLALLEALPKKPHVMPQQAPHLLQTLNIKHGRGHKYQTTLDSRLQAAANNIVAQHTQRLRRQEINNIAVMVVDNQSFKVLAYVGNSRGSGGEAQGHAIDLIQRPRSTGSILKPLLFASMLQQGEILPESLIVDLPTQYAGYMPQNYDHSFRGAVAAKEALARSLNIPAVRMLKQHGVDRFYDFLRHMGMSTLHRSPDGYGLSLILGGAEGTLWDMTGLYANMADIARGNSKDDNALYRQLGLLQGDVTETERLRELHPASAWMTLNALLEVTRPGDEGYWKNFNSTRKVAWKTGTSYGLRDAWAIGNSSRYTVAVWVGNASGVGRPELTGLNSAAPLMFDLFNRLPASEWFSKPEHLMKQVQVCRNDGYLANGNCKSKNQWIPRESHFDKVSKNNIRIHLDKERRWRVHGSCESIANMVVANWFVLPAGQEFYYRKRHATYRSLPVYRKDCRAAVTDGQHGPIEIIYPGMGTRVYIPKELGASQGNMVLRAVHRKTDAVLYWHINDKYLGQTRHFHQQSITLTEGRYKLTLVDKDGNTMKRYFKVLSR